MAWIRGSGWLLLGVLLTIAAILVVMGLASLPVQVRAQILVGFGALVVLVVLFLICREILMWYWKINRLVSLLEDLVQQGAKTNRLLEGLGSRNASADVLPTPGRSQRKLKVVPHLLSKKVVPHLLSKSAFDRS